MNEFYKNITHGDSMSSNFKIDLPFDTKPPRLKELVNQTLMGEVWIRDTPFGPVTDSVTVAIKFELTHRNVLRAIAKVHIELGESSKLNGLAGISHLKKTHPKVLAKTLLIMSKIFYITHLP